MEASIHSVISHAGSVRRGPHLPEHGARDGLQRAEGAHVLLHHEHGDLPVSLRQLLQKDVQQEGGVTIPLKQCQRTTGRRLCHAERSEYRLGQISLRLTSAIIHSEPPVEDFDCSRVTSTIREEPNADPLSLVHRLHRTELTFEGN